MNTTQVRTDVDARVVVSEIALRACIRDPLLSLDQALNTWTEEAIDAMFYAEWVGTSSALNGEPMPAVFSGTILAHSWRSGRNHWQEFHDCPDCNADDGRTCIVHDH